MIYILLCVFMNVGIFICFRLFSNFRVNALQGIVFNYITCVLTGIIFVEDKYDFSAIRIEEPWVLAGLTLGVVFMVTFYLMAVTTQKFSITVSSVASKMSVVIPVLFSLLFLNIKSKEYSTGNYFGIFMAILAIVLSAYKGKVRLPHQIGKFDPVLPVLVFIMGGVIDTSINFVNYKYLRPDQEAVFPIIIFISASAAGTMLLILKKQRIRFITVLGGVILGIINYFSIFFVIKSLSALQNDGAIVYPIVNVGIILISAIVSVLFFKEKLAKVNLTGIILALISILLLSYQEILTLLNVY